MTICPSKTFTEMKDQYERRRIHRLAMGEAYMMCNDCRGKLYSFDGHQDSSRDCPTPSECFGNK